MKWHMFGQIGNYLCVVCTRKYMDKLRYPHTINFSLWNIKKIVINIKHDIEWNRNIFDLTIIGLNCKLFR